MFAKYAYNSAFSQGAVRDALTTAVVGDCRKEISYSFVEMVREALSNKQADLFGDYRLQRVESLRSEANGYPFRKVFLDAAVAATEGQSGNEALVEAVRQTVLDLAIRRARQVEEHYHRQPKQNQVVSVRERIESAVKELDEAKIASGLVGIDDSGQRQRPTKQIGLDDGVQL